MADHRLGAAVALLFLQGWRVSEVLGLAWEDLDLDAGTAQVRRASVYVDGRGQQLGPPKTEGARGEHWLMPTVVALLRQAAGDAGPGAGGGAGVGDARPTRASGSASCSPTPTGGLVLRQTVAKVVKQAAKTAGIAADLGTHAGRRTVVTTLFVDGDEALEDIARFVGHAKPVDHRRLREAPRPPAPGGRQAGGRHPRRPGLEPTTTTAARVRNHPAILGATLRATAPHRPTRRRTSANVSPGQTANPGRW